MVTAELVMPIVVDLVPRCYFCKKVAGEDDYCYGCGEYICENCYGYPPSGRHDVAQHQEIEDD